MKAINIASGVAVTALALAISAQANAAAHGSDTEATFVYTGSMNVQWISDFEAETNDVDLLEDSDKGAGFDLNLDIDVNHGPFAGTIGIRNAEGVGSVTFGDIIITDGPISFGQLGTLVETESYTHTMGDANDPLSLDAGLRYTMEGLKVQVEGANAVTPTPPAVSTTEYGVAAQYSGATGAIEYIADAQFRTSDDDAHPTGLDDDAFTYVGAGVSYDMTDMLILEVAVNNSGQADKITEYGFNAEFYAVENFRLYVRGFDSDVTSEVTDDSLELLFGASYALYAVTPVDARAEYTWTQADGGDFVFAEVVYEEGAIKATADVTVEEVDEDAEDPIFGAELQYTRDNGVEYVANYDFQSDITNKLTLSARYSF